MKRWEYMTFKFEAQGFWVGGKIDHVQLWKELAVRGDQGWELVSFVTAQFGEGRTGDIVAVFKREKE